MSPAAVAELVALLSKLGPPLLDAVVGLVDALRHGKDPTPAERHLQVQAAFALLGLEEKKA